MHNEQLEHEISLLKETPVILVCPQFGNVSISYGGMLNVINNHPVLFHVTNDSGIAIIFTVDDVNKLERATGRPVLRLKGPHDYRENYSKV